MKKKIIILAFLAIFTLSSLNAFATEDEITVPFIFDNEIAYSDGQFVNTVDSDGRGQVYTIDGKSIDTIENASEILENSYIKVSADSGGKWTVFTTEGNPVFPETYDVITITENDVAIVANGESRPPGIFSGKYGAIDLLTGKTIVPIDFYELSLSADKELLIGVKFEDTDRHYFAFDLSGLDVTDSVPFVCYAPYPNSYYYPNGCYPNGYYCVLDLKTGLLGIADKDKKLCTAITYDYLGEIVMEGAVIVGKDFKYGLSTIDGSGELLLPLEYESAGNYENGMFALKKYGWVASPDNEYPVIFYYGDGSYAFSKNDIVSVYGVCGDILYVHRKSDNSVVGVTKTGEVASGPFQNAYVSFSYPGYDFVLLGSVRDGYADPTIGGFVVNRWGEVIASSADGQLLSDGAPGRGLSLVNLSTDKILRIMADGTKLPEITVSPTMDYNSGWMVFNEDDDAYITDLFGNVLIPKGKYSRLDLSRNSYYGISGQYRETSGFSFSARDKNGKYGAFNLNSTPYIYPAHTWAQEEIGNAIQMGLVPADQQRDWRDACTRADFCRLIAPLLDAFGLNSDSSTSFSDVDDEDILRAASLGIVKGTGNGKFSPSRPITRQEAAVILSRCANLISIDAMGDAYDFSDKDTFAPWATYGITNVNSIICGLNGERVMQGVSQDRFLPLGYYTREQTVLTILRLYRAENLQ